jgi:hypothetical protein
MKAIATGRRITPYNWLHGFASANEIIAMDAPARSTDI